MAKLPAGLRFLLGTALNALRVPGFVAESEYRSSICNTRIRVSCGPRFTVVSVNGLDIYFDRLTGAIDGVGLSPASHCRRDATQEPTRSDEPPFDAQPPIHS